MWIEDACCTTTYLYYYYYAGDRLFEVRKYYVKLELGICTMLIGSGSVICTAPSKLIHIPTPHKTHSFFKSIDASWRPFYLQ